MTQSSTWDKIKEQSMNKKLKFLEFDDLDDKAEQIHKMDIDDADMQVARQERKTQDLTNYLSMLTGWDQTKTARMLGTPKRTTGGSSSSSGPKAKLTDQELFKAIEMETGMDMTEVSNLLGIEDVSQSSPVKQRSKVKAEPEVTSSPVKPRAKTKARTTKQIYTHDDINDDEPENTSKVKVKKTIHKESEPESTGGFKTKHGDKKVTFKTFDEWKYDGKYKSGKTKGEGKQRSLGFLNTQLSLRKIYLKPWQLKKDKSKDDDYRHNEMIKMLIKYDNKQHEKEVD